MLPLWKPLVVKANTHKPVIFDVFGDLIDKPYRPFVIFYDDKEDCYYYLRARNKYGKRKIFNTELNIWDKETFIKQKYSTEILCEYSDSGLFKEDSYVDCSQIFKCNKDLLESLVEIDTLYENTKNLEQYYKYQILDKIKESIMEVPPYLSIVEVYLDDNDRTEAMSLYLSNELLNRELPIDKDGDILIPNIEAYASQNNNVPFMQERYWNGINFCKLFLNEYFPDLIHDFEKIQHLNDDNKENENNSFSQKI